MDNNTAIENEVAQAIKAYDATWPNHCTKCQGYGGSGFSYDPSPSGVSLSSGRMYDWDPCEYCAGRCPRCAHPWDDPVDVPETCPSCALNYAKPEGRPQMPESDWSFEEGHAYTADPHGLVSKYCVFKSNPDGTPGALVEGPTFTLRPYDPHARKAMLAYADSVQGENAELATDLMALVSRFTPPLQ